MVARLALSLLTLVSLLLTTAAVAAPPVPVTACGQTLRGPTSYYLTADLICTSQVSGLGLESATLDLRGFTLDCRSVGCLTLRGTRSQVRNGTIRGFMHDALVLEGQGGHRVENISTGGVDGTILVSSNDNRLTRVSVTYAVGHPAIAIHGNDNRLEHSVIDCPGLWANGCVTIDGHGNRVEDVTVTARLTDFSYPYPALLVQGNDNTIRLSTITNLDGPARLDGPALVVDGRDNRVLANRLSGLPDAIDLSGGCVANHWRRNLLLTSTASPACLLQTPSDPSAARTQDDD